MPLPAGIPKHFHIFARSWLREIRQTRSGNWHYRVNDQGDEWTGDTGLAATKRNVNAALSVLAKARDAVRSGQANKLAVEDWKFNDAADEFLRWAEGEHKEHPNTAKRLGTSFASLKRFFGTERYTP